MRAIQKSFLQMLLFIKRDMMLFAACLAPILTGIFFKFGIPAIEKAAVNYLHTAAIFYSYYGLLDYFFSILTPTMLCFTAAMVILEERDNHIEQYLFVTALGKKGYIISHILLPASIAFILTVCLLPVFKLTNLSFADILNLSFTGALQGAIVALLIITLSTNKLEGMAIAKISTILLLGAVIPYLVSNKIQYLVSFLPSFWIGRAIYEDKLFYFFPAVFLSFFWIYLLLKHLSRKIL